MTDEQLVFVLYTLLDDVDTLDDAVKGNDKAFREHTRSIIKKRHQYIGGFKLNKLYKKYYHTQSRKDNNE